MDEELKSMIYAGIIDEIGRGQYYGSATRIREYIQNAIGGTAKTVRISFHRNDFEISDDGESIDQVLKGNIKKVNYNGN